MPRLKTTSREELAAMAPLFELVESVTGFVPNSMMQMGIWPELTNAFTGLAATILGPDTHVPADLKQMIALVASQAAGCQYCMAHTAHSAAKAGAALEKIENVWSFETSPLFTEAERIVLGVARDAAQVPNAVTDEAFEALKAHFDDRQIIEIMSVISLFGFLNRWNDTMATELEDSPLQFGQKHLAKAGWDPKKHL
ncbi:MAG: fusion protein [Robiginitomaculum sp.]|nr:MAG: fusion protein [Robiginitomaculum sp.]